MSYHIDGYRYSVSSFVSVFNLGLGYGLLFYETVNPSILSISISLSSFSKGLCFGFGISFISTLIYFFSSSGTFCSVVLNTVYGLFFISTLLSMIVCLLLVFRGVLCGLLVCII